MSCLVNACQDHKKCKVHVTKVFDFDTVRDLLILLRHDFPKLLIESSISNLTEMSAGRQPSQRWYYPEFTFNHSSYLPPTLLKYNHFYNCSPKSCTANQNWVSSWLEGLWKYLQQVQWLQNRLAFHFQLHWACHSLLYDTGFHFGAISAEWNQLLSKDLPHFQPNVAL